MLLLRTTLLVGLAFGLAACDSGGDPGDPTGPTTVLRFDFEQVFVELDCDSTTEPGQNGPGEFEFAVDIRPSTDTGQPTRTFFFEGMLSNKASTRTIGTRPYELPATEGQSITVTFVASEVDPVSNESDPPNDPRLDEASISRIHTFGANDRWTPTGRQILPLGSGGCRVELPYTATQQEGNS